MSWTFEVLSKSHDKSQFDCGQPKLNTYLHKYALQHQKNGISKTHVLIEQGQSRVCGYLSICCASTKLADMPDELTRKLPKDYDVPSLLLARLAIDKSYQGQGLGSILIQYSFELVVKVSDMVAARMLVVDAIDEKAVGFYERFGFQKLDPEAKRLYILIGTIRAELTVD